ncbi:hypothetical protein RJ639_042087 [Escallonia herrerae]|uniref:Uncharacterized protein n=1 Tax=Escallonia herrerae TaxID=1293975 RepID=A0AA88WHS6_9ASTE|nr:hypothetical protein RJ639_042087 [Escallonia herrerae]
METNVENFVSKRSNDTQKLKGLEKKIRVPEEGELERGSWEKGKGIAEAPIEVFVELKELMPPPDRTKTAVEESLISAEEAEERESRTLCMDYKYYAYKGAAMMYLTFDNSSILHKSIIPYNDFLFDDVGND